MSSAGPGPALVVLAAGLGRRYGAAKQIAPLGPGGALLLDYTLTDAAAAGFGGAVVVVRPEHEAQLQVHLRPRHPGLALAFAHQRLDDLPAPHHPPAARARPWGTTHALLAARHQLAGPFGVANADDYYGAAALQALGRHLATAGTPCLVPYRVEGTLSEAGGVSRAVVTTAGNRLAGLRELLEVQRRDGRITGTDGEGTVQVLGPGTPVSMNLWGFDLPALGALEGAFAHWLARHADAPEAECYLSETVGELVRAGRLAVEVLPPADGWLGVTHPADAEVVKRALTTDR